MPELPEVRIYKKYFDSTSLHQKIKGLKASANRILETPKKTLNKKLVGEKFEKTRAHGKYLFARAGDNWLVLHFGMTGDLHYGKGEPPEHTKLQVLFENDYCLSFQNPRKLGKVGLVNSVQEFIEDKGLGPDALRISYDQFKKAVQSSRGTMKYTLMNQKKVAGVGNIYSDEILYQTRIHPETKANQLSDDKVRRVYDATRRILRTAIRHKGVEKGELPNHYLIPYRHGDKKCPKGHDLKKIKVSGRSTYYCPAEQKKSAK